MFNELLEDIRDKVSPKPYRIFRDTFDQLTMKAKALDPNDKQVDVHGTYAWAPQLTWYDDTNKEWIDNWEWDNV